MSSEEDVKRSGFGPDGEEDRPYSDVNETPSSGGFGEAPKKSGHGPPPGHPRFDQVYDRMKELEQENERLKARTPEVGDPSFVDNSQVNSPTQVDLSKVQDLMEGAADAAIRKHSQQQALEAEVRDNWGRLVTEHPDLHNTESPLYKASEAVFKQNPQLGQMPNGQELAVSQALVMLSSAAHGVQEVAEHRSRTQAVAESGGHDIDVTSSSADEHRADVQKALDAASDGLGVEGIANLLSKHSDRYVTDTRFES